MPAHRYWRLTGVLVTGSALELTDCMLLVAGATPSPTPILTATIGPDFGTLSTLLNGTASEIVSWPVATARSPGFALIFDCGVAGTVEFPGLRLGAGSSRTTFPRDLIIQFSDDGRFWEHYQNYAYLTYPGDFTLTSLVAARVGDPSFNSVVLLLDMDGTNGSTTFVDTSPVVNTVTAKGGAQVSTAAPLSGSGSLLLNGTNQYLRINGTDTFNFGTGDFTLEATVSTSDPKTYSPIFMRQTYGTFGAINLYKNTGVFGAYVRDSVTGALTSITGGTVLTNTAQDVAATRIGGVLRLFVSGVLVAFKSASHAVNFSTNVPIGIGAFIDDVDSPLHFFAGKIDNLRITKGVARYTSDYTPPTSAFLAFAATATDPNFSSVSLLPTDTATPRPLRFAPAVQLIAGADPGPFSAYPLKTRGYTAADVENGGQGRIYGTVKEKSSPTNVPLNRKVLLMDERSGLVIRGTWSNATTGAFEFRDLAMGRPYTTISYDHLRNYRAVIADNQLAELQT